MRLGSTWRSGRGAKTARPQAAATSYYPWPEPWVEPEPEPEPPLPAPPTGSRHGPMLPAAVAAWCAQLRKERRTCPACGVRGADMDGRSGGHHVYRCAACGARSGHNIGGTYPGGPPAMVVIEAAP